MTSLAKCLRDLEQYSGNKSGGISLSSWPDDNFPIFQALIAFQVGYLEAKKIGVEKFQGNEDRVENASSNGETIGEEQGGCDEASTSTQPFKPLQQHLTLQLDNSGKDNKNQMVMAFYRELVSRGVFEKIQMSFLMVGHTHQDIDALFYRVSH